MAEAPKDRFRRLIKELSEDDRTFLDTNLLGIYRRGIEYGKVQGFFSDSEAKTYRGVADQRIQAIQKIPVLDQQGQPITKTVEVPVIQNGKEVKIKRTTQLSPFDLQKKTGGLMEGGDINGPIFTGRSLGAESNLSDVISQRVKLKEQIAPAIQTQARDIEQKRGQSALFKPGTLMGLTAGAMAAPFVGASKDMQAAVMRGAGVSADEIARKVYTYKQPELDNPFALGVEQAGIFGQTLEESVLPSVIGTGAGILTGGAAATLAAPTAPFTAGLGPAAAAIAVGMPTAYYATELAQKGQAAVKKAILGDDVYAARKRQMAEATAANPYGAIGGQMAANFAVATPTLPSLTLLKGGLAAGKTGANIARAERALINAGINPKSIVPSAPLTGMAGRISNSKFYNFVDGTLEGAITSKAGQKLNLDIARGGVRGFTRSAEGQEFMSDIAERSIEGMTDLRQAIAQREKDKLEGRPETPLYQIMAQTLFGSLFEGRGPAGRLFDVAGKAGNAIGEAGLRAIGDTTTPTFGPLGQLKTPTNVPSKVTPGMPTGNVPTAGRTDVTERLELPQNIIPMGRGRIAEINREGFTSTVKSVNDLPGDYLDIRMGKGPSELDLRDNVYNAVSRIAPDAGTFARVKEFVKGPAALKAEKVGDSFEQLAGFTDDGFAKINVIRPDGTSTYNTVSVDTLAPANQKKALSAMQEFGIKPSDTTGYVKSDVQRDILKNFDLQTLSNPELKNNFQNEFWMGDTLVPGRIVSKVDENHVVMQLPSPTSGVDMIVVPNVNVERMGQPQTIYDTRTIPAYDPSNYTVDKEFHSPIRATADRVTTKDLNHPMLLTPEQASRAERARTLIVDKKRDLATAGESAKNIKAKADASIKAATNEMLAATRAEAEYAFDEGTLIEFVDASGQSRMGVVVDNSPYGPVVVDADAPTKPAFIVQESSILKTSVPMQKIRKAEPVVTPTTTEENVARRTGRKRKATATTPTPVVPDVVAESEADVTPAPPKTVKQRRKRTVNPEAPVSVKPEITLEPDTQNIQPLQRKARATSKAQIENRLKDGVVIDGVEVEFPKIPYETATLSDEVDPATGKRTLNKTRGKSIILDFSGRKLVVADINGVRIPFYLSTGYGGKTDVPPGKWYPVFGIDPMSGWFNKTSGAEITSYYGSPDLGAVSKYLDNTIGDVRDVQVPKVAYRLQGKVTPQIDFINRDVNPVTNERPDTAEGLRRNIDDALAKVDEAVNEEVIVPATTEAQVEPTATPQEGVTPTTATPEVEVTPAPVVAEPQVTPSTVTTMDKPGVVAIRPELQLSPDVAIQQFPQITGPAIVDLERTDGVTGIPEVVGHSGRFITILNIKGQDVLYYLSSGENPKVDATTGEAVSPGKWYPFFGFGSDGWLNKSSSRNILDSYGQQELRDGSDLLNNYYGDLRSLQTNDPDFMTIPKEELPHTDNIFFTELSTYNTTPRAGSSGAGKFKPILDRINSVITGASRDSGLSTTSITNELRRLRGEWDSYDVRKTTAPVAPESFTEVPTAEVTPESTGFEVREMTPADIVSDGSFVPDIALDVFAEAGVTLTPTQETMIAEGDIEAVDEGSYLENVQPGDVTVAEGDSLVRIRASVEGVGDIDEVLAKARNRQELEVVLKDMLVRSGQVKGDADSTTAAKAVAAYYDEMIHAFVNRDLYVAQLVMQDVEAIIPVERKTQAESRQPLSPEPISDNLSKAAKKIALRRNRAAALIQQYDMPRINSIMEAIDSEASSSATLYNQLSGEYFVPKGLTFEDITGDDARRSIIERVRMKMVADRYKTNIPVFKVIDAGPKLDSAYDNIFEKRGGYTTIVDERTNAGQQVIFVMANNSDIGTTVHEISHAILDNMPVHMASELATRFGKTLRKPTKLNESYIPYELHEMFATAMEQSFLSGTPPVSLRGAASGQARLNDIWGKISGFMQKAYAETYGFKDAAGHVNWRANRLEWSVPYDNNNVFLWDGIPVTLQIDGKLVRATVLKTKEKPKGPGLIPDSMIHEPMVTVELLDPVSSAIITTDTKNTNAFGSTVVMPSEIISVGGITQGMSPKLGSMMVKWVSGYSTQTDSSTKVRTPIIGLRGTYTNTNERLMKDNPSGLLDRITDSKDGVIPFVDKIIKLDKDGMERTSTEWKGYLLGLSNRTMSAANRALNYGLITNIPNDVSHTDYNQWINVVGSLREGQFLKEYTYKDASGKTSKLNTLEWTRAGLKDLANTIQSLEAYTGTLELQNRERQSNAQRGAGNTGGNVLYQSRRRGADATLRKEAAQRIAGNSNPHSITPEAFAHYATYDGVPRDVIKQFVDDRVVTDAHRTFDGTADIRTLEINDVLVVDGTIDATDTLGSLKKALDFVQRNGIDNLLLHTQAGKTEPLGYSDKGYSVEPSITFTSTDAITDDVYSSIRKEYPAIRISPDRKSVTMTHLEERGKSYEGSLESFGKAIKQVADKFIEADIPVQGVQSTERLWNFGNENGRGYAINYDEARNVLNLSAPNLFGVDPNPKFDVTIRQTIEGALSAVRGKTVNLPAKFDMNVAPDTLERWTEAGNQFNKLPDTFISNTDSKKVYPALIKELPKQFKFLELTVGFPDSRGASKVIIQPDTRVDPYNPLLQNSGITTIDGKPLKHSEVIDAIYQSIRANVQVVSGGEHSHNLAFAAHASITQDPMAIWGMWSETIGRSAYSTFSSKDSRKTGLPPLDAIKTGVVGVDKRIDTIYKDANNQFGHLKITDSNNSFSPATLASGRGVTLFSARKRDAQSWSQYGGPMSRDFNTHESPDVAAEKIFTNDNDWEIIPDIVNQMSNRNSALFQMFGDNRDHMVEYLMEAVLAKVNITGNRRAGVKALQELDVLDEGSRTANVTLGSYVKAYIQRLDDITDVNNKPVVNPVNGKAKLYHASNALINITDGSLVSANTISRRNGNMDDTLVHRQGENEGEGLGGTPAVVSLTYSFDYAVDIAKVASNLRNVLIDSKELDTWRSAATRRVKLALTTKDPGKSFINDRIRRMSGIDNKSVPSEYKSMVEELINDNHGLDILMMTNARMQHPDELVIDNYYDAIGEIETYMPSFRRRDPEVSTKLSATMNWLANNKAPQSVKDTTGVNPVYAIAYAQWKSKAYTREAINDRWENTKELLDAGGGLRISAVETLASVELNYEALGLPATTIFPASSGKLASLSKEELMNRSIGILEYETDASKLFEHYEPEKEVRTHAPSSLGTPTAMYNPYGKPMEAPTTNTYKTLWSARPVKPPVREVTTVDDDGTVKVVRTQDPAEVPSKVKEALKITDWVMKPYGFVNDLARNSVGGDWSAILIQNWVTANPIENPKLFAHQFMIGLKMMKPNLGYQKSDGTIINQNGMLGREEFHKLGDELRSNPFYELGVEAGLTLNTHRIDERLAELRKKDPRATIMNVDELGVDKDLSPTHQLLKHQPLQGASERTMAMTKDYIKMMKFTQGMQHYIEIGYNPKSSKFTEVAKDLAGMLNVAQGDVKFSSDKEMDDLIGSNLRNLMFAPRWLASRFMFDPILRSVYTTFSPEKGTKLLELNRLYKRYGVIDPYVRAENNRLFMKSAGMFAFIGFLLSRFNPFGEHGTEVEVKGLGSSIRVGDYVFKAPGGVMYQMEIMSTLIGGLETKPGESSEERLTRTADQLKMLIMSKASPAVSLANDMITGRNIIGEPSRETYKPLQTYWNAVTRPALLEMGIDLPAPKLSNLVADRLFYLWAQDAMDTYDSVSGRGGQYPGAEAGAVAALAFLGGRVRYSPKELKWQYKANDNDNPVPGWEYTIFGADEDEFFEEQARNVQ